MDVEKFKTWPMLAEMLQAAKLAIFLLIIILLVFSGILTSSSAQTTTTPPIDLLAATNAVLLNKYGVQTRGLVVVQGHPINDPRWKPFCLVLGSSQRATWDSMGVYPTEGQWMQIAAFNPGTFCLSAPSFRARADVGVHPHVTAVHIAGSSPLVAGPVAITEIPTQTVIDAHELTNCTDAPLTADAVNLSVAIQRATSITETKTVTNSGTFTLGGEVTIATIFKINISASYTNSTSFAHADMDGVSTTITKSSTETVTVPPKSTIGAELSVIPITYSATVSSILQLDGELDPYSCFSTANSRVCPKKISDLVEPNNFQFPVTFQLTSQDSSAGTVSTYNLPYTPADCAQPGSGLISRKVSHRLVGRMLTSRQL